MIAEDIAVRDEILRNMPRRGTPRPRPTQQSAVGYGRITKASKTKLATQRQRVEEYIKVFLPGVPMDAWYEDNEKSRVRSHNREGYQQAVAELLGGQRSHLVTFMLERWSGDDIGMTAFIRSLWVQGIEVHDAVRGKITEENLPLLAQFARLEIKTNSQRSMSKQRAIAEEGYKLGRPPLGYKWVEAKRITDDEGKEHIKTDHGRTEPDQPAWDVLRRVFPMAADETIALSHTRQWMNEQLGLSKDDTAFHRILTNRYYVGLAVQLREDCYVLNPDNANGNAMRYVRPEEQWVTTTHPHPVCTPETFAAVQRRLERRKTVGRNTAHPKNPLTGFIYCAKHPHRRMRLHYPRTGHVNYRCRICVPVFGRAATRITAALAAALAEVGDVHSDPERVVMTRLTSVETARCSMERQLEQDKARLREISRERGNATRHLNAGLISPADYAAAISLSEDEQNDIRARIHKVERALASMGQGPDLGALGHYVAQVRAWCTAGDSGQSAHYDVAEIRRALQYVVQRITLDEDAGTIIISWSPDMAVIMGKEATKVPCPTGRTRRAAPRLQAS